MKKNNKDRHLENYTVRISKKTNNLILKIAKKTLMNKKTIVDLAIEEYYKNNIK